MRFLGNAPTTSKGNSSSYSKRSYWWSWDIRLPTDTAKKSAPIFYDCRSPQFTFCNCESIHFKTVLNFKTFRIYPQNFQLDISKYRQIQIYETPKIHSSYQKILKIVKCDTSVIIDNFKRKTGGTSRDNEWQRVVQRMSASGTISDSEWQTP